MLNHFVSQPDKCDDGDTFDISLRSHSNSNDDIPLGIPSSLHLSPRHYGIHFSSCNRYRDNATQGRAMILTL